MIQVFSEISQKLSTIKANETIIKAYESLLQESEKLKIVPVSQFVQIARNPNPQFNGLVIECLIIDKNRLYDLVIGTDTMDFNTIWIKDIVKVGVHITPIISNENNQQSRIKEYFAQLEISYSSTQHYFYKTNLDRLHELYELSSLLTNMR